MIEIYDFMALDLNERANYLWDNGIYLMNREENGTKKVLYFLNTYYVEVFYNISDNSIYEIKPFKSIRPLEPYLNTLELPIY